MLFIHNRHDRMDAATFLATDDAILWLVVNDPRYLEPYLSQLHGLRIRLVFDQWHDGEGGSTQVICVYEVFGHNSSSYMIRHVKIARGAFGSFDLQKGVSVHDKPLSRKVFKAIKREFVELELPAIREGTGDRTNTNDVEVSWMFNRTSRQAGWSVPNSGMTTLEDRIRHLADDLIKGEAS